MKAKALIIIGAVALLFSGIAYAKTAPEIDASVKTSITQFKKEVKGAGSFLTAAKGILVFPKVRKAGVGVGGEYGEGALQIDGKNVDYYKTASASIGLQLGAESKSVIIAFMDEDSLKSFRESEGWEAGVNGSIALIDVGASKTIDTTTIKDPIVGFAFGQKGLMGDISFEGTKYTKMNLG